MYSVAGDNAVPDAPTVYDVVVEMPLVTVLTDPWASVSGFGHEENTVASVQKASSVVTVGSDTAVHDIASVVPPAGAVTVGVGATGLAAQAVA